MSNPPLRTGATFPSRFRQRYNRSKSGCLCCRRRRKKCDEKGLICTNCARRSDICEWPSSGVPGGDELSGSSPENDTAGSPESQAFVAGSAFCSEEIDISCRVWRRRPGKEEPISNQGPVLPLDYESTHPWHQWCQIEGLTMSIDQPSYLVGSGGGILRDPQARLFFEHYVAETACQLGTVSQAETPFITLVLPLALSDDLIMHSLLALSGAHLSHEKTSNAQIHVTTYLHYAIVVHDLQAALAEGNPTNLSRLLLATLMLCTFEAISGNTDGAIFHHLKASSQLLRLALIQPNQEDKDLLGFLLELYAYLVLVGHITPNSNSQDRVILLDPIITSPIDKQGFKISGIMFGCAQSLFSLIPSISLLGSQRFLEDGYGECPTERIDMYRYLRCQILDWHAAEMNYGESKNSKHDLITAATIYQHSLLIFLHASFHGYHTVNSESIAEVEASMKVVLSLLWSLSHASTPSPLLSIMMWPIIITGSCLREPRLQANLRAELLESSVTMSIVTRAVQLLDCLWGEHSELAYGPVGLEIVMKKHGLNMCMS